MNARRCLHLALAGALLLLGTAADGWAQKYGGILRAVQRENPPNLSIHEAATVSVTWVMQSVYSNLALYNAAHAVESADDLTPELAESWDWSDGGQKLTFKLRHGVKWHDGQPFTANDVKYTIDLLREVLPDKKLRLNPRKLWYENVKEVVTNGDYEVTILLKNPQPSLLSMLATGYSPIYPAHVDPNALRTKAIGTGPFRLKTYEPDQLIEVEKNPDYFIKGRPYLDGIKFTVIKDRQSRAAALIAGQVDLLMPQEAPITLRDQVVNAVPTMVVHTVAQAANYNIVIVNNKPPFDNLKVRQAVNYALDRHAFLKTQLGGAVPGGMVPSPPYNPWGLPVSELNKLPGYGDPAKDKAQARKLLEDAGYSAGKPLRITVSTRSAPLYQDMAVWMIAELKGVGIEATLAVVESSMWFPNLAKREILVGANMTASGSDDPDAWYFENYLCGSQRNYSDYCNRDVDAEIMKMSQEQDKTKRRAMVWEIERRVALDAARPVLGHALDFQMNWPHVKGYVPHNSLYSYARFQDAWLDQ
jgi:peptide/nickel transport system substrate-binding protein